MPLQINPSNGEPYIQLPAPHDNIRITPPRLSDVAALTEMLNSPTIYPHIYAPPFPFLEEHAVDYIKRGKAECEAAFERIKDGVLAERTDYFANAAPVRFIREVLPDGTDLCIGDMAFGRNHFPEIDDKEERVRILEKNNSKEEGDPEIIWRFASKSNEL